MLLCVALMFFMALLTAKEILPEGAVSVMPAAAMLIASFFSARMSSKALGRALLTSLIQGLVNLAICYVTGMIVFMRIVPNTWNLYSFLACVAGAVLGGLFTAGVKPRRHKIK